MVMCSTTGNPRERFVKRLRQTSTYDCYGPWRGHDSAPWMGPYSGLADAQKNKNKRMGRMPSVGYCEQMAHRLTAAPHPWRVLLKHLIVQVTSSRQHSAEFGRMAHHRIRGGVQCNTVGSSVFFHAPGKVVR